MIYLDSMIVDHASLMQGIVPMNHLDRWTLQKITGCLELIKQLDYPRRHPIEPFKYTELANPDVDPAFASADRHHHEILLPYKLRDGRGEVVREAYDLNDPVSLVDCDRRGTDREEDDFAKSLVSTDAPNVVIETVKQAEDGEGIILRLYEHHRSRGRVNLHAGLDLAAVFECNLLEVNQRELEVSRKKCFARFPALSEFHIASKSGMNLNYRDQQISKGQIIC